MSKKESRKEVQGEVSEEGQGEVSEEGQGDVREEGQGAGFAGDGELTKEDYESITDWIEEQARSVGSPKISHAMITAGTDWRQNIARASFETEEKGNSLIFFKTKLEIREQGLNAPPPLNSMSEYVYECMIATSSKRGKSRYEAIEAEAGVLDQAAHQLFITGKDTPIFGKMKKGLSGFLKRKKDDEGDGDDSGQ